MGAISGVDINKGNAGACAPHVQHDPLDAVGGPDTDAISAANAERPQPTGYLIRGIAEFGPCHAARLVSRNHSEAIRELRRGAIEQTSNCQVEERNIGSARVAKTFNLFIDGHVGLRLKCNGASALRL
jgi:hypothetical protein